MALADVQRANLDGTAARLRVDPARTYHGPNAFRRLAESKLDAVIIETPTLYHPEIAMAAVEAGKHVFLAKPVAVDVPGCRTVLAAGARAMGKRLTFLVDFQTRVREVYQEAAAGASRRCRQAGVCAGILLRRTPLEG